MNLYAESSAVLSWLLWEPAGTKVRQTLEAAGIIIASDLTLLECDRTLIRAITLGQLDRADGSNRRSQLVSTASGWHILRITEDIVIRARQPFPSEPLRALDAIHLASALAARSRLPDIELLSLDDRIRRAAASLGFIVLPV